MESIGIGALARRAGVGIDTVRYYEVTRLRFIRRAQALGFTLREVRELLALSKQRDVARIRRTAQTKLDDIAHRIASLERVRQGLERLVRACPGHGRAADCPILKALGNEEDP